MSAAEDRSADVEQRRLDLVRVRGYAIACCDAARLAREELEAAADVLGRAREDVDAAVEKCQRACELAERMSAFAARAMAGDVEPDTLTEVAMALEELVG